MLNGRMLRATLPLFLFLVCTASLPAQEEDKLTEEQMRSFLQNAEVVARKNTPKGVTSPYRLTLSDGKITHDAGFNYVNESKPKMEFKDGRVEMNFKDSYKYNIAAYELGKLLGLADMMPVTVERTWERMVGSISWWLPVKMDEATRVNKKIDPPDAEAWNRQIYKKRIFTELVYDTDSNLTNMLISDNWHLWMIDFTRAFRLYKDLRDKRNITESRCERHLLENLRKLDREQLADRTKGFLTKAELEAVMARRDKIVAIYDELVAQKGAQAVLYEDAPPPE